MAVIHVRLPENFQRFRSSHNLETRYDQQKRRYYLYLHGRPILSLSFSESEWNSSYPATCVSRWAGTLSHQEDVDQDAEDRREAERVAQRADEVFEFMAKEYVKYGIKGSQAPGPCSVVVDGFRNTGARR